MSLRQMSDQVGVSFRTLGEIQTAQSIRATTLVKVRGLKFEPPDDSALIDATGTRRRLAALWRDGFPIPWIQEHLGTLDVRHTQVLIKGGKAVKGPAMVRAGTAAAAVRLYDELDGRKPDEFGIPERTVSFCGAFAKKRNAAPRACWDPDTIDDPDAIPEWTGACGTPQGLRIHYRDDIPTCQPCLDSRFQGKGEKAPRVDGAKLRAARKAAGMSVAGFARRVGCDTSAVYYWETGRSAPRNQQTVDKIVTALKIGEEDICGDL